MTETQGELFDTGWSLGWAHWRDMDVVSTMRCQHTNCGGRLNLESWCKLTEYGTHDRRSKLFTQCTNCGRRKSFR